MRSPRRTHIAASVAYAALAATMTGVLLSSAHLLPEVNLPTLHLSSEPATQQPAEPVAPKAHRAPARTATARPPAPLQPVESPTAQSTRTCDAIDFDCLVAGPAATSPTGPGGTEPPVQVRFQPSAPPPPARPPAPASEPTAGTTTEAAAGTGPVAPSAGEVPSAVPSATPSPTVGTPTPLPTPTPTPTPTATDTPDLAPATGTPGDASPTPGSAPSGP